MSCRPILALALFVTSACGPSGGARVQAIVGAVLIDGRGGPPLTDSIVVVSDGRILAAGRRSAVPLPSDADIIDGSGKYLVPQPIDILASAYPLKPSSADDARAQIVQLAKKKPPLIDMDNTSPEIANAALNAARAAELPVYSRVSTQSEVERLLNSGASGFIGMIRDTEAIDPALVTRLRDLRIVIAPALSAGGEGIDVAKRNTFHLFRSGVPLAIASLGDIQREMELLAEAGVPPYDILVAATRNGAAAQRRDDIGTVEEGKRADLILVSANPGEDIRNLRKVALRIHDGR